MSIFNSVKLQRPKSSTFDLSHENKLTCDFGQLVPFFCQDVIPGDKFKVHSETFLRFAPLVAPIMHEVNVYMHYFFVPNRILWKHWEDFITGGRLGESNVAAPYFNLNSHDLSTNKLLDYLGYQAADSDSVVRKPYNSLPLRAYLKIYDEFYRDQNLSEQLFTDELFSHDGEENSNLDAWPLLSQLRYRCMSKDYFTSALPWTQRGGAASVPIGQTAPINFKSSGLTQDTIFDANAGTPFTGGEDAKNNLNVTPGNSKLWVSENASNNSSAAVDNHANLYADLSSATGISINDLRRSVQLQAWLERNALGGGRYIEQILAHFGVRASDYRLQRPEYLGGGMFPAVVSEVLQQSQSTTNSPQGTMTGHAISVGHTSAFKRRFEEHGFVIGIMSVMPKPGYFQGIPRFLRKLDKLDYAFPEFSQLGEQPVYEDEIFNGSSVSRDAVFGYQPRYGEYKHVNNQVHGDFRTSLEYWHLAQKYSTPPNLNADFVSSANKDFDRIFAVTDSNVDHLWVEIYNHFKAKRPLPYYGTPNLGHPLN